MAKLCLTISQQNCPALKDSECYFRKRGRALSRGNLRAIIPAWSSSRVIEDTPKSARTLTFHRWLEVDSSPRIVLSLHTEVVCLEEEARSLGRVAATMVTRPSLGIAGEGAQVASNAASVSAGHIPPDFNNENRVKGVN